VEGEAGGTGSSFKLHVRDEAVFAVALEAIRYIEWQQRLVNSFAGPNTHEPQRERGFP
jgi:alpha-D-ribose 1-methylphosphonate 5-triphosphate synthase subunit PhnI